MNQDEELEAEFEEQRQFLREFVSIIRDDNLMWAMGRLGVKRNYQRCRKLREAGA